MLMRIKAALAAGHHQNTPPREEGYTLRGAFTMRDISLWA